jgi:hypothetical protein
MAAMDKIKTIAGWVVMFFATSCMHVEPSCDIKEAQKTVAKIAKLNAQVSFELSDDNKEIVVKENEQVWRVSLKNREPAWKDFVRINEKGGCIYSMNSLPEDTGPLSGFSGYIAFERGKPPRYVLSAIH